MLILLPGRFWHSCTGHRWSKHFSLPPPLSLSPAVLRTEPMTRFMLGGCPKTASLSTSRHLLSRFSHHHPGAWDVWLLCKFSRPSAQLLMLGCGFLADTQARCLSTQEMHAKNMWCLSPHQVWFCLAPSLSCFLSSSRNWDNSFSFNSMLVVLYPDVGRQAPKKPLSIK